MANYFTRIICTRCHIPNFPLFVIVSLISFSNFFTDSCRVFPILCHLFHSCHVHQPSNSQFSACLFLCFSFFSFHLFFSSSLNFRTVSQYSEFPSKYSFPRILQSQSSSRSVFHFNYFRALLRTTALRFQAACFSCFFFLGITFGTLTPSHRWDWETLDWSSVFLFLALLASHRFPLLSN